MATIALYAGKINNMSGLIQDMKGSVIDLKSDLSALKNKSLSINKNICNLDEVISSISTSTQTQEDKIDALNTLEKECERFSTEVQMVDSEVADIINQRKNDFYNQYSYLKPDCEKNGWEKFCDGVKSVGEWCKENWGLIRNIVLAIIVVTAIVVFCIVTFGAGVVVLTAVVGAVVGLAGQLVSDVISWAITGEWTGTWQSYVGALLGGIAGGVLMLTGNVVGACAVDAAISTLLGESLEGISGGEKRTMAEIWIDTAISAGTAAVFSKLFSKFSDKLSKSLSNNIPALKRLAGRGSYDASFKMVTTKLKNGTNKKFTIKSVRNGVVSGLAGDVMKNVSFGFGFDDFINNHIKEMFTGKMIIPLKKSIVMPQINLLSNSRYLWRFI